MPRYTFPEIKYKAQRLRGGKRQQKTFTATENPWNRDAKGNPKAREQIWDDLKAQAQAWIDEE